MKVKINNYIYKIEELSAEDTRLRTNDGQICFGICETLTHKIYLLEKVPKARLQATLAHELTHAFMDAYGLDYNTTFTQEQMCEFVAAHGASITKLVDRYIAQKK